MDILDIINEPVETREKEVDYRGVKYLFRASSDASDQLDAYMASDHEAAQWAKHCSVMTKREVKPDMARWCHMVKSTMTTLEWDSTKNEWVQRMDRNNAELPKLEWDIVEICQLAQRIGTDFVTVFVGAAKDVLGTNKTPEELAEDVDKDNTFTKLAAGNLDKPEADLD